MKLFLARCSQRHKKITDRNVFSTLKELKALTAENGSSNISFAVSRSYGPSVSFKTSLKLKKENRFS
jgi:hypothetical protein